MEMTPATANTSAWQARSVSSAGRRPSRLLLALSLLAMAVLVAACGADGPDTSGALRAEGLVVDVQGTISEVKTFDLLDTNGERMTFTPEDGALERSGFSPAHVREHMALAQRIAVRYEVRDGTNVLVGIDDADE